MSWGDEVDEELQQKKEYKAKLPLSFKSMTNILNYIEETQREWDDKTPRDSFRRIWAGNMIMMLVFFCATYNVVALVSIPFMGFYFYVLIKLSKAYKHFGYKRGIYWFTTIVTLILLIGVAFVFQKYVLNLR